MSGGTGGGSIDNPQVEFEALVFQQELYEVYLLIDFISGRADKNLSDLKGKIARPNSGAADSQTTADNTLSTAEILEHVSRLRYPPSDQVAQKAEDAAFLLTLKDVLNSMASPARGLTIAYTIMFTEGSGPRSGNLFRRRDGRSEQAPDQPLKTHRVHAAQNAFPGLVNNAQRFSKLKNYLSWSGLFITIVSAVFLWQVTYGVQLASRFDDAKNNEIQAEEKLYDQLDKESLPNTTVTDLFDVCNKSTILDASARPASTGTAGPNSPGGIDHVSSTTRELCNDYSYRHAQLCVAIADIGTYSQFWTFWIVKRFLPVHVFLPSPGCPTGDTTLQSTSLNNSSSKVNFETVSPKGRQEDALSVADVLATMANYILPIMFGLIGTIAALVRGIQDKVSESILAPRDRALALIRLPLGMMAGVCVGLFFNPATLASQHSGGLGGALTLSASGVAFLAGYGAEGFFRMLDLLILRVFSLEK